MRKRIVTIISLVLLSVPSFSNNIVYGQQESFEWSKQFSVAEDSFCMTKNEPFKVSGSKWYEYPYDKNLKKTKEVANEKEQTFAEFKYFVKCIMALFPMLLFSILICVSTKVLERIYTKKYCVE